MLNDYSVGRRVPYPVAVVQHDRQNQRQPVPGLQPHLIDDLLPEQTGVDLDADRHPPVDLRLKFQHQVQIDIAAAFRRYAPDHVTLAPPSAASMELCVDPLHAAEIQPRRQCSRYEVADELL